jgi:hypothetical protein
LATLALVLPGAAAARHRRPMPFQLGLQDETFIRPASVPADVAAMHVVNGSWVRLLVHWSLVAPQGSSEPQGFDASDPADPRYFWAPIDQFVRTAAADHLKIILTPFQAPTWAEGPNAPNSSKVGDGAWDPDATDFGAFMHAFAERYSGSFPDPLNIGAALPRVKYWEIWNEENLPGNLAAPNLVDEYRSLLNAGYGAVKSVNRTNVVIVGGLAPISPDPPLSMSPMPFAAGLMCLGGAQGVYRKRLPCPVRAEFDKFGFHPYTLGATPTVHSPDPNDLFISDTGRLTALLALADKRHLTLPREHHQAWATEWSLFTDPPQPVFGVADRLAARYVDYSMYLLWHFKIPLVIWFVIRDPAHANPLSEDFIPGGGLYWPSGREKLMGRAVAFPMLASVGRRRAYYWGRVPLSRRVRVFVQRAVPGGWRTVASGRTNPSGVFFIASRPHGQALYRAYVRGGPVSLGYNSRPIPAEATRG